MSRNGRSPGTRDVQDNDRLTEGNIKHEREQEKVTEERDGWCGGLAGGLTKVRVDVTRLRQRE